MRKKQEWERLHGKEDAMAIEHLTISFDSGSGKVNIAMQPSGEPTKEFQSAGTIPQTLVEPCQGLCLNLSKGMRINFIRVIIALFELGFFLRLDGSKATKKEVFEALGKVFHTDFSRYTNDMTRAMADNTALNKHLRIFDEMREVMLRIFNLA